jgi:hypothetical protein
MPSANPGPQYTPDGIMTLEWQALTIQNWLNEWVEPRGGYTKVLASPKHLWEEIYKTGDEAPRVLICFNGEKSRGDFKQANTLHRVDREWLVAVLRGHGFKNLMAEGEGVSGSPGVIDPFYKDVQILRDRCRVMINITEEAPPDYKGMEPIPSIAPYGPSGNVFIDGYAIRFSVASDIPAILDVQV